ncbi:MAG TPA: FAD-binding oxidoreductase [Afifellaceae bacterium]|nr:FAD-binding oxidoreductase [Afifellaceae bacterium]
MSPTASGSGSPHDHAGSWYAARADGRALRSPPAADQNVHTVVVGGGLAGISTAWQLARAGLETVVVEAHRVGWGASGRNGGFVSPGFAESLFEIEKRRGLEEAKRLFALSRCGVSFVEERIRELELDRLVGGHGKLKVIRSPDTQPLKRQAARMARDYDVDLTLWPADVLRETLVTERYHGALHDPEPFHIDPLAYVEALAVDAEKAGARLHEQTHAEWLRRHGASWQLDTLCRETGKATVITAEHVVLATSAYGSIHLADLYAPLDQAILPVATYVIASEPLGARLNEAIRFPGCIADTRRAGDYYRIVGQGEERRLLWGGRITTRRSEPHRLADMLKSDILEIYPQLGDFGIEYAWSGLMGYTRRKMPVIGELEPGLWAATAFGGHGLNVSGMAAELVGAAIAGEDDRWTLFKPFHPGTIDRMAGGSSPLGRVATQAAYWSMQLRDRWDERSAR